MSEALDDVLNGEPEPEKEPETTDVKAEPEKEPEKAPETESSSDQDIVMKEVNALKAELARIREKNRQLKEDKEPEPEPPNIWEDPDGRLKHIEDKFDSKLETTRLSMSEMYARKTYQDYDQKLDVFMQMVEKNPALAVEMRSSQDPASFAYETANRQMTLDRVGNLDELEKKIKEEALKEAEAKAKAKYEELLGRELPDSLSDAKAAGDNSLVIDESLDDVIGVDPRHR
jgi:hypothetical protein